MKTTDGTYSSSNTVFVNDGYSGFHASSETSYGNYYQNFTLGTSGVEGHFQSNFVADADDLDSYFYMRPEQFNVGIRTNSNNKSSELSQTTTEFKTTLQSYDELTGDSKLTEIRLDTDDIYLNNNATNINGQILSLVDAESGKVGWITLSAGTGSTGIAGSGTTNYIPKFTSGTTLGNSIIQDNGSKVSVAGVVEAKRFAGKTGSTSITRNSNTGTDGSVSLSSRSTDVSGSLSIIVGTYANGAGAGNMCTVNFDTAYDVAPIVVIGANTSQENLSPYVTSTTTGFNVYFRVTPAYGGSYSFNYIAMQ